MMCALPERDQINPDEYWRSGGGDDDSDIESIDTNAGIGIVIDTSAIGSILFPSSKFSRLFTELCLIKFFWKLKNNAAKMHSGKCHITFIYSL